VSNSKPAGARVGVQDERGKAGGAIQLGDQRREPHEVGTSIRHAKNPILAMVKLRSAKLKMHAVESRGFPDSPSVRYPMKTRILCVAGARPNFMKLAPLVAALNRESDFAPFIVHTGQHYDDQISGQFFRDLGRPAPKFNLSVGSGSHAQQTILKRFEPVVLEEKPDGVVVVGDVNSTMGCALVAKKLQIPVIHVEAGLGSFDRGMPEEINRLVTDAISDLLLVTGESGRRNLIAEGTPPERIFLVGNLMIDSLRANFGSALNSSHMAW
jgi:UDP-N-acetylglucosamine 2-epimerase (non-hydrolysing)